MELEKPRNIDVLKTAKGVRLNAIWNQKKDRWYIVEPEDRGISNIGKIIRLRLVNFNTLLTKESTLLSGK
jgi:hypothetical protein